MLIYHLVFPAKYRKVVFSKKVEEELKEVCLEIAKRYEMHFLEIGTDEDHVHFLVQTVPINSVTKLVRIIKSITARELFKRVPELKKELWGGEFWTDGYYATTVGRSGSEKRVADYVKQQGKRYERIHKDQLKMWE